MRTILLTIVVCLAAAGAAIAAWSLNSAEAVDTLSADVRKVIGPEGALVTFADNDFQRWRLPQHHRMERFVLAGGDQKYVRLTSLDKLNNKLAKWGDRGLSFVLPLEFNKKTSGRQVEIGVIARKSKSNPSANLSLAYATQQAGNSGWKKFVLTDAFKLYKFTYTVPAPGTGYKFPPILVVHSDPSGKGHAIELMAAYFRPL